MCFWKIHTVKLCIICQAVPLLGTFCKTVLLAFSDFLSTSTLIRAVLSLCSPEYLLCDDSHHRYVFKNILESPYLPNQLVCGLASGLFIDLTDWTLLTGTLVYVLHIVCACMHEWVWELVCVPSCVCVCERERDVFTGLEGGCGRLFHLYEWIIKALITSMAEVVVYSIQYVNMYMRHNFCIDFMLL